MRIAVISALIMCALSFGAGQTKKMSPLPRQLQGDAVPNFLLLAPDNKTRLGKEDLIDEAKKIGAKRVVFSFFASWCVKNCAPEIVLLKENSAKLKEKGVQIYLIDVGENLMQKGKDVSDFVEKYAGSQFPFYFDQKGNLLKNFGIIDRNATEFGIPVLLVMDADLRVLDVFTETGDDFPQILWENL